MTFGLDGQDAAAAGKADIPGSERFRVPRQSYDEDLVWADGYFIRWPEKKAVEHGHR